MLLYLNELKEFKNEYCSSDPNWENTWTECLDQKESWDFTYIAIANLTGIAWNGNKDTIDTDTLPSNQFDAYQTKIQDCLKMCETGVIPPQQFVTE